MYGRLRQVQKGVRNRIYDKILRLPLSYFSEAARVTDDPGSPMSSEIEISVMSSVYDVRDPFTIIIFVVSCLSQPSDDTFRLAYAPLSAWACRTAEA
jgi:hypothetical protein